MLFCSRAAFNSGLYWRSQLLGMSRTQDVVTCVPMHYLSPFFKMDAFVPQRQPIAIDLTLADPKTVLILKDGMTNNPKFKLVVKAARLKVFYCVFLPSLKDRWVQSLAQLKLKRSVQIVRNSNVTVPIGSSNTRITNAFNFGITPASIVLFFVPSVAEYGNYKDIRFSYSHNNVQTIQVFLSGNPIQANHTMLNMDTAAKNGVDVYQLYLQFIQMFGENAVYESIESFHTDFFLFCINLSPNPRMGNDYGVTERDTDRQVSFLRADSIDIFVEFKEKTTSELIFHCNGYFDKIIKMSEYGELLDD